ncbi:hypothetical protein FRB96_006526 [Tulasnella sp. 330]|nr:hypothetical protein FRB96_006526 [Tulasnella sp. 330]
MASGFDLHTTDTLDRDDCNIQFIEEVGDFGAVKSSTDLGFASAGPECEYRSTMQLRNDPNKDRSTSHKFTVAPCPVYVSNIRGFGGVTETNERRRKRRSVPTYWGHLMKKDAFSKLSAEALQDARAKLDKALVSGLPMTQTGIVGLRSCFWVDEESVVSAIGKVTTTTATPSSSPVVSRERITKALRRPRSSPSSPGKKKSKTRGCVDVASRIASASPPTNAPPTDVTKARRVFMEDIFVRSQFLMTRRVDDPVTLAKLENDPTVPSAQERLRYTPQLAPDYSDPMDELDSWRAERDRKEIEVLGPRQHWIGPKIESVASQLAASNLAPWTEAEESERISRTLSPSPILSASDAAAMAYGLYDKYASTSAKYPASHPSPPMRLERLTNRRVPVERRSVDLSKAFFGVAPLLPYRQQGAELTQEQEHDEEQKDRGYQDQLSLPLSKRDISGQSGMVSLVAAEAWLLSKLCAIASSAL